MDGPKEYLFLESLGGKLISIDLEWNPCNSLFGNEFDNVVFEQLQSFAQLLEVNKRSKKVGIRLSDDSGEDAHLDPNFKLKYVLDFPTEDG